MQKCQHLQEALCQNHSPPTVTCNKCRLSQKERKPIHSHPTVTCNKCRPASPSQKARFQNHSRRQLHVQRHNQAAKCTNSIVQLTNSQFNVSCHLLHCKCFSFPTSLPNRVSRHVMTFECPEDLHQFPSPRFILNKLAFSITHL